MTAWRGVKLGDREIPGEEQLEFLFIVFYSSFLLLVVRPGAPSSVLAPSSDALCY